MYQFIFLASQAECFSMVKGMHAVPGVNALYTIVMLSSEKL